MTKEDGGIILYTEKERVVVSRLFQRWSPKFSFGQSSRG